MSRGRQVVFAALLLSSLSGCASRATAFTRHLSLADRAYAQGRYEEAAKRYEFASRSATEQRDRDEAVYREAESYRRAGRSTEASQVLERLLARSPRGERAPRAAYEHALLAFEAGDVMRGNAELDTLLREHPESGISPAVLKRRLDEIRRGGESKVCAYLDALIPSLDKTELGQYLHYEYAASLEADGRLPEARARYLFVARRYPYPEGALWDDALYRAADLDARLGDPRAAISHLDRMLSERETAYFIGSYEKGRYEDAALRIAELQRDALHDPVAARRSFERLWSDFPKSHLRDDGAWQAAALAVELGDRDAACRLLGALMRQMPGSRYVGCIPQLCPRLRPGGTCHEYLIRNLKKQSGGP